MRVTRLLLSVVIITVCFGVGGCKDQVKGLSAGEYRVSIETIEDHASLLVQRIAVTTTSRRQVVLVEPGGRNSSSASPSTVDKEKTTDFDITLTVNAVQSSATINGRQAVVSVVITQAREMPGKTIRRTRFAQMSLPIEDSQTLLDLITQRGMAGLFTEKESLLRIECDQKYIELYIE